MIAIEAYGKKFGGAAHDVAQFRLMQRQHIDQLVGLVKRLVFLQFAKEIRPQAHPSIQKPIAKSLCKQLREAATLALLSAHVKFLAPIDIEEERSWLGMLQF